MVTMLQLDITMNVDEIKQAILKNQEFVEFLSPECGKGYIFFSADKITFVLFHTNDNSFDIYLSYLYIRKLDPQKIGPFVDRVKQAIKEICAEKYHKN